MLPLPQFYPQAGRRNSSDLTDVKWYLEEDDEILEISDLCRGLRALCSEFSRHVVGDPYLTHALAILRNCSSVCPDEFLRERGKVNAFECLGKGPRHYPFINRSAMKMVNIDNIFNIVNKYSQNSGLFSFVDLCGGPGGFSEYLVTQCSTLEIRAKGFAMSLSIDSDNIAASCNWKLTHVHQPPFVSLQIASQTEKEVNGEESKVQLTIVAGADGTGNIFNIDNILTLSSVVMNEMNKESRHDAFESASESGIGDQLEQTAREQNPKHKPADRCFLGVDFVCGDGGTGEGRDKEDQEVLMLPLLAAQVVAMLRTLREGGSFLLKGFSIHTVSAFTAINLLHSLIKV